MMSYQIIQMILKNILKSMRIKINDCEFKDILKEYERNLDVFSEDSPLIRVLDKLEQGEKNLLVLYAELGSHRKVSKIFNCSATTIQNRMRVLKIKFKEMLVEELKNNDRW